jgi:hypothetical protein
MTSTAADVTGELHAVELLAGQDDTIAVRARDHSWVAVLRDGEEIISEQSGRPEVVFVVGPGAYQVCSDGTIEDVSTRALDLPPTTSEPVAAPHLVLTADAPDRHAVDGVGEIPADGESYCTISVVRIGPDGQPAQPEEARAEVFLRATGGVLMDNRGRRRLRSVRLRRGRATFRLVSERFPRLVVVHAFERQGPSAQLPLEFVWSDT